MMKKALSVLIFMLALGLSTSAAQDQSDPPPTQDGDKSQAAAATAQATPTAADSFYQRGLAQYESKQFKSAAEAFKRAARLRPRDADIHYRLGMAYYSASQFREAVESYKQAARLRPEWSDAHFRLGWMYYILGKRDSANAEYKILQKLNAEQAETLYRIIKEKPGESSATSETKKPVSKPAAQPDAKEEETRVESRLVVSDTSQPAQPTDDAADTKPAATPDSTPTAATEKESKPGETAAHSGAPDASPNVSNATTAPAAPSPTPSPDSSSPAKPATTADTSAPTDEAALVKTYRVGVGDVLDIRFANSPTTRSTLYTVSEGGYIEYPLAGGPMNVSGLTTEEINARLAAELKRRAVNQGTNDLLVSVRDYVSHNVVISGLVNNPGMRILHREAVPLYVVLADAQPRPEASRAVIMRTGGQVQVDLTDPVQMSALVRPGDVITVSTRPPQFYFIGGKIMTPGQKPFQQGLTLVQAILAAGGLLDRASGDVIDISREGEDGRLSTKRYKLKEIRAGKVPDPRLQPGDRIEVSR